MGLASGIFKEKLVKVRLPANIFPLIKSRLIFPLALACVPCEMPGSCAVTAACKIAFCVLSEKSNCNELLVTCKLKKPNFNGQDGTKFSMLPLMRPNPSMRSCDEAMFCVSEQPNQSGSFKLPLICKVD